jgi:3-deoxy-D-manno-octulosonic acid (KDO) 8-phosphate synthase
LDKYFHLKNSDHGHRKRVEMIIRSAVVVIKSTIFGKSNQNPKSTHSPPNNCMPSRAKMRMKRKSRNNSEMIDRIEFISEMTKLRRLVQYLKRTCLWAGFTHLCKLLGNFEYSE